MTRPVRSVPGHRDFAGDPGMTLQAGDAERDRRARDRYPRARSAILPALWAVQHEQGLITPDAMTEIAGILQVTPSDVEAVSTFYSMYFQRPHGRTKSSSHQRLLRAPRSRGNRRPPGAIAGLRSGETTADGAFTWSSTVECLAAAVAHPPCKWTTTSKRTHP